MPKRSRATSLTLPPRDAAAPNYRWLSGTLRAAILEGRLAPGSRLPSTRDLAREYGLSRGTIVSAFQELGAQGYVSGRIGSGTYVNTVLPDELLHVGRRPALQPSAKSKPKRTLSAFAARVRPFPPLDQGPARPFRSNVQALDLFPATLWAQVAGRRLRRASVQLLRDGEPLGYTPLREALAEYLTAARGVRCTPRQICIVAGTQEALDLVARITLDPGDHACVECPGYVGAMRSFAALGTRITSLAVDAEGARLPHPRLRARLAYLTPAHQFPLGISMSLARRLAWLDWARRAEALIFEDDYDSEFRFTGRPFPALQGIDRHGVVLYAGSFSKVLFPSLRIGYLVVPDDLVDVVEAAKSVASRHVSLPEQAVLCDFIREGHFGRHVRRMREVYGERRAALLDAARQHLAGLLEIAGLDAGLQTAGWLRNGMDAQSASRAAAERGVEVTPLDRYAHGQPIPHGLHLGFAAFDGDEIRRGVSLLAAALERVPAAV